MTQMRQLGHEVRPPVAPVQWGDHVSATTDAGFVLPVGTITLVLADIEGSSRLWESRPDEMRPAMARFNAVVDEAVGTHGGVRPVEQGEGDSFLAAFPRATQAVACALEISLTLASEQSPINLRLGIHTGEVEQRAGGNYAGTEVNRCARLRDTAHGGQIVVSQPTHDLVLDRLPEGVVLRDLGSHRLRDLARPEHLY
ncbi:MAG TPA: adenylate/guanylate cyclase domain-containing protein, partial [Actinomycetota bacterium]|nr:adenylate/guanylate cyclase domain-containing protein [Actinomycetota bacterium]